MFPWRNGTDSPDARLNCFLRGVATSFKLCVCDEHCLERKTLSSGVDCFIFLISFKDET